MDIKKLKFDANGLIPAVAQDYKTKEVLMLAYMNEESIQKTFETGYAHYWSRSRKKLWKKGEESGHVQKVKELYYDCDADTILIKVEQTGTACHTGSYSCFFNNMDFENKSDDENDNAGYDDILETLYNVIKDRKINPQEGSYTNYLFGKGIDKILKKVGEETSEVIIASKNGNPEEIKNEVSDLIYHLMVMMVERNVPIELVFNELSNRRDLKDKRDRK